MSPPPYPFEEFLKHMDEVHSGCQLEPGSWEMNVIKVNEYMKGLYPDAREKQYKLGRFMLIMEYVSEHVHDLDQSDYAVYGSDEVGALVGYHVLRAVHEIYTTKDLGEMERGPSPEEVMRLADKYRDLDG
jgi:hypothetical protein